MALSLKLRLCYGVGHVLNDLCASMWFTYLLVFFHFVLNFNNSLSGLILLIGQIADAISTPIVGIQADEEFSLCKSYGKKKTWHLIGTVCVLASFPFIFLPCIGCENSNQHAQVFYYAMFVIIFQFGWAATQVSHLSLIPKIATNFDERTELNAIRYAFTVLSNIAIYSVTWLVLGRSADNHLINNTDTPVFRTVMVTAVAVGLVFSIIFHFGVEEKEIVESPYEAIGDNDDNSVPDSQDSTVVAPLCPMSITDWFKEPQFYKVVVLYMATRLFVNLSQVYTPLYLQDSLQLSSQYLAIIPLIMFISGFLTATCMKVVNRVLGRKIIYFCGCIFGIGIGIWVWYGAQLEGFTAWQIYVVAVLLGASTSTLLITSLSITSDLIGGNTDSGAFVYGFMSAFDKVSNGAAVVTIQALNPCSNCCSLCNEYYRQILAGSCVVPCLIALLALLTLVPSRIGHRRKMGELMVNDYGSSSTE